MPTTFYVVEIDHDPNDRHAATTLEEALDLANPDPDSIIRVFTVKTCDSNIAIKQGVLEENVHFI